MRNIMMILKEKFKGGMKNSRSVTLTPPPCTSEETILENTGINWSCCRRINRFCKGKSRRSNLVTFLEGVRKQAEKRDLQSTWLAKDISQSLSAKALEETVLPCDKRKGATWLNIQLNNWVAKIG